MGARQTILDPSQNSPEVREFEKALRQQVQRGARQREEPEREDDRREPGDELPAGRDERDEAQRRDREDDRAAPREDLPGRPAGARRSGLVHRRL